jgi:hypothetical protein
LIPAHDPDRAPDPGKTGGPQDYDQDHEHEQEQAGRQNCCIAALSRDAQASQTVVGARDNIVYPALGDIGNIGVKTLSQFVITFDQKNERVRLTH